MREFPTCEGVCRERKLELVTGGDYDDLATAAATSRIRIDALLPIAAELAGGAVTQAGCRGSYESFRERARLDLHAAGAPAPELGGDAGPSAQTIVVWQCPDCGGLEETQPCIGVCIWRLVDWVNLDAFEMQRSQALDDFAFARALSGLLARFVGVTPRMGEWERNWRAFQAQARLVLGH